MRYRITAPVAGYDGVVAGAVFSRGVAEVDSASAALAYCRRKGYRVDRVEPVEPPAPATPAVDRPAGPPRRPNSAASKAELVAYAAAVLGMSEVDAEQRTRPELFDAIAEHHDEETQQ